MDDDKTTGSKSMSCFLNFLNVLGVIAISKIGRLICDVYPGLAHLFLNWHIVPIVYTGRIAYPGVLHTCALYLDCEGINKWRTKTITRYANQAIPAKYFWGFRGDN